jgi:anti-sigma regulatory factor (Ser/Thr protein kinase)
LTATLTPHPGAHVGGYRHAAVFYAGREEFLAQTVPFLREAVARGEPALVVVSVDKIEALRAALGPDADAVEFADMEEVGANPARIIPAWQEFVAVHDGRSLRGIGEPIHAARGEAELTECQHHERLLNPALADSDLFLICPYDTEALPADVIAEARRSHPLLHDGTAWEGSDSYDSEAAAGGMFDEPLPEPAVPVEERWFDEGALPQVRAVLRRYAATSGLGEEGTDNLVLAAGELATNSVRHGGGHGILRLWREDGRLICEVRDGGQIEDPLIDRRRPVQHQLGGWGLWMANQASDLLQLRSLAGGTVARLHIQLG